ncbi:unnamed protein product [Urochloa humidicola]
MGLQISPNTQQWHMHVAYKYIDGQKANQSREIYEEQRHDGHYPIVVLAIALLATAAAASGTDPIRLPTGGGDDWPWKCCNSIVQDPSIRPPIWQCNDVVEECSPNCRLCLELPAGNVCRDWVTSVLQPSLCTPRPWDCCDAAVCTRQFTPYCQCSDKVEACSGNCKECELVEGSDPPRYRCLDQYHGYLGPMCTPWISSKGN